MQNEITPIEKENLQKCREEVENLKARLDQVEDVLYTICAFNHNMDKRITEIAIRKCL